MYTLILAALVGQTDYDTAAQAAYQKAKGCDFSCQCKAGGACSCSGGKCVCAKCSCQPGENLPKQTDEPPFFTYGDLQKMALKRNKLLIVAVQCQCTLPPGAMAYLHKTDGRDLEENFAEPCILVSIPGEMYRLDLPPGTTFAEIEEAVRKRKAPKVIQQSYAPPPTFGFSSRSC